jgi:hypothetical protein
LPNAEREQTKQQQAALNHRKKPEKIIIEFFSSSLLPLVVGALRLFLSLYPFLPSNSNGEKRILSSSDDDRSRSASTITVDTYKFLPREEAIYRSKHMVHHRRESSMMPWNSPLLRLPPYFWYFVVVATLSGPPMW